ncbi:MAG TPA: glycosyltransferase family 2 protein [Bacteroidia bacterium]|nr:glycosyltransferase family 2 protein [Bacteroidia bacterium]
MLSVCIPVYNVNVGNLVKDLSDQVALLDVPVEIIVIDDRSNVDFNNANKTALANKATYIALPENVGRARIRNMFLKYTQYPYLLFLDCDSAILDKQFLANYITEIKKGEKVICGGRVYSVTKPKREKVLHWTYGRKKESKPAAERQLKPNASFMTNNFVVERKVFEAIQLNEKIKGYGHEDTLFGYELKLRGINIKHIDNAVLHADLHTNKVFMDNTESAIRNLAEIVKTMGEDSDFTKDIALLQYYNKLKKNGLLGFVKVVFAMKRPFMRYLLCSGFASMFYLDFYKLGYYVNTANK